MVLTALIDDIRSDLSPKHGSLSGAMISFFLTIAIFVAVPYLLFTFASGSLTSGTTVFGYTDDIADGVWGWIIDMMKYAFPMILLSVFIGFYRAGSYARIPFKILFALYLGSWLWIASHGGVFSFTIASTSTSITLDVRYIAYVMIMICFAMVFLTFSEFGGNRKKYLEALEKKKDTMSERKARRLSR